jgi:hypothetical protein
MAEKTQGESTKRGKEPAAVKVALTLTAAQHKALKVYVAEEGTSLQDLLFSAVSEKLKKKGVKL